MCSCAYVFTSVFMCLSVCVYLCVCLCVFEHMYMCMCVDVWVVLCTLCWEYAICALIFAGLNFCGC